MPFIDLNQLEGLPLTAYDFTITGAGAAGILLAIKLSRKGFKVQLLESGHFDLDEERQQLNEVECTSKMLENAVWGRKRAIGGTTIAWGGQSLPFSAIDFEHRKWVPLSGWPIAYGEVEKYYGEANAFMKIDDLGYSGDMLDKLNLHHKFTGQDELDYHVSKWANEPDFFKLYKKELDLKVDVYYNAVLHKINYAAGADVSSISILNFTQREFLCSIKKFIICAGGIETVRIMLLNSQSTSPWLGKCFMEHPCIEVADIIPRNMFNMQQMFNVHVYKGKKYSLRLSLSRKMQECNELMNCSASITFTAPAGEFNPYAELKAFTKDHKFSRLMKLSGSVPAISKSLIAYLFRHFHYKPKAIPKLALMIEQEPQTESNISLANDCDIFGNRKARLNWSISGKSWKTAVATSVAVKKLLEGEGIASVKIYPHVYADNKNYQNHLYEVNHHMGGTRMSAYSENGVVDTNLRVWNSSNMYLCSSSVFPTSSHSNPTLTLLALTCRLANHLSN